jgi:HD superfamily phosphohydrolase
MAIEIFQDKYPRHFFHQLISGQLDVDRLDYLSRDCYFTGVVEGVIGAERIIKMMNVADDKLCVEIKGIYSIEKFLIARRMMYWQVYLHKASIAAEQVLISLLRRAICLAKQGEELFASPSLRYFLYNNVEADSFDIYSSSLENYARFDDSDIYSALKVWQCHKDNILSLLSEALTDRRLFKVKVLDHEPSQSEVDEIKKQIQSVTNFTDEEVEYLCRVVPVTSKAYSLKNGGLNILRSDGNLCDVSEVSDILDFSLLSKQERKYYLCYYDSRQYFSTQV